MRQALELALEALEEAWYHVGTFQPTEKAIDLYDEARTAIKEALAQPEQDNAYIYASNLAKTIWQKHYMKESPKFALLDTTEGVLTQIDNMTCGLVREKPAQPEQEPVGKLQEPTAERAWFTIAELNAWANKKLLDNPQWVMPTEEPERKEALAQEQDNAYIYASNLAKTIWQKHYIKESPKFALLDTTEGVLTQIDNMTCGLVREKPAQQEPTGMLHIDRLDKWLDASLKERKSQRTWVDLAPEDRLCAKYMLDAPEGIEAVIDYITAKLKENNT